MRAMLLAFATMFIMAFAADYLLHHAGFSSAERHSSQAVRID